jgi:hypothetical protein
MCVRSDLGYVDVCPVACYGSLIKIIIRHPLVFYARRPLNLTGSSGRKAKSTNDSAQCLRAVFEKAQICAACSFPRTANPSALADAHRIRKGSSHVYCYLMVYMQSTGEFCFTVA